MIGNKVRRPGVSGAGLGDARGASAAVPVGAGRTSRPPEELRHVDDAARVATQLQIGALDRHARDRQRPRDDVGLLHLEGQSRRGQEVRRAPGRKPGLPVQPDRACHRRLPDLLRVAVDLGGQRHPEPAPGRSVTQAERLVHVRDEPAQVELPHPELCAELQRIEPHAFAVQAEHGLVDAGAKGQAAGSTHRPRRDVADLDAEVLDQPVRLRRDRPVSHLHPPAGHAQALDGDRPAPRRRGRGRGGLPATEQVGEVECRRAGPHDPDRRPGQRDLGDVDVGAEESQRRQPHLEPLELPGMEVLGRHTACAAIGRLHLQQLATGLVGRPQEAKLEAFLPVDLLAGMCHGSRLIQRDLLARRTAGSSESHRATGSDAPE